MTTRTAPTVSEGPPEGTRIHDGWHFTRKTLRGGTPIPPNGVWLMQPGKVVMCWRGLHWSPRIIDALRFAPGLILHRVKGCGDVQKGVDLAYHDIKYVGRYRQIQWRIDATEALRRATHRIMWDVMEPFWADVNSVVGHDGASCLQKWLSFHTGSQYPLVGLTGRLLRAYPIAFSSGVDDRWSSKMLNARTYAMQALHYAVLLRSGNCVAQVVDHAIRSLSRSQKGKKRGGLKNCVTHVNRILTANVMAAARKEGVA